MLIAVLGGGGAAALLLLRGQEDSGAQGGQGFGSPGTLAGSEVTPPLGPSVKPGVEERPNGEGDEPRWHSNNRPAARPPRDPPPRDPPTARPPRPTATDAVGYLAVTSRPWSRVVVDGEDTHRNTPITADAPLTLTVGRHQITLVVGIKRFNFTVDIKRGATTDMTESLPVARPQGEPTP